MTNIETKEYLKDLIENEDIINSVRQVLNRLEESNNKAVERYKEKLDKYLENETIRITEIISKKEENYDMGYWFAINVIAVVRDKLKNGDYDE